MSTQLRELFDGAAESQPPDGLAARAVAGARRRRTQRYTVAGSVLAAAAVVLGFVMVSSSQRLDGAPRPNEVAGLPDALPAPDGLPTLVAGTMDAASAAYIVDGEVVVIDAATGEGALVDFASMGLTFVGPLTGVTERASLALSPDGKFLALTPGLARPRDGDALLLVDVVTGKVAPQNNFLPLGSAPGGQAGHLAWAPDGQSLACICVAYRWMPRPGLYVIDTAGLGEGDFGLDGAERYDVLPRQISWGTDGLVAQLNGLKADWRLVPEGGSLDPDPQDWPPVESVSMLYPGALGFTAVVMGQSEGGGFLARVEGGDFWVVTPFADTDTTVESNLGVQPVLGALQESYFIVFTDWKGDPLTSEVARVDLEGETTLTTLPAGAKVVSFASELVD